MKKDRFDKQTKTKAELKAEGFTEKEIHLCDCGCGLNRNDVPCFATPNYVFIMGHQPSDATPFQDPKKLST